MVLHGFKYPCSRKMEEITYYLINPQYGYKKASNLFFVNQDLQIFTTLISIVNVESLGHVWDVRYLKPNILAFSLGPD